MRAGGLGLRDDYARNAAEDDVRVSNMHPAAERVCLVRRVLVAVGERGTIGPALVREREVVESVIPECCGGWYRRATWTREEEEALRAFAPGGRVGSSCMWAVGTVARTGAVLKTSM